MNNIPIYKDQIDIKVTQKRQSYPCISEFINERGIFVVVVVVAQ